MTSDWVRSQGLTQMAMSSAASRSPATGSVSRNAATESMGTVGGLGAGGCAVPDFASGLTCSVGADPGSDGADAGSSARANGATSKTAHTAAIPDNLREEDIGV